MKQGVCQVERLKNQRNIVIRDGLFRRTCHCVMVLHDAQGFAHVSQGELNHLIEGAVVLFDHSAAEKRSKLLVIPSCSSD